METSQQEEIAPLLRLRDLQRGAARAAQSPRKSLADKDIRGQDPVPLSTYI